MKRPFTLIAAIIFALIAGAHIYRIVTHFEIVIGSHHIAQWVSYLGVLVAGGLAIMLLRENPK